MQPFVVLISARASMHAIPQAETDERATKFATWANGNIALATDRSFRSMSLTGRLRPAMRAARAHSHHKGSNV